MKKFLLGSLLVCSLSLVACSNNNDEGAAAPVNNESNTEVSAEGYEGEEQDVVEMSFKDGELKSDFAEISIDNTQLAHDNFRDTDGLIVWWTVKNISEVNDVPENDLEMFAIKQQDDSTEYDLTEEEEFDAAEALYPMYTDGGDSIEDADTYNEAIDDQQDFRKEYKKPAENELLPDKSVQVVTGITLNNTEHPVMIQLDEDFPASENEEYKINLD